MAAAISRRPRVKIVRLAHAEGLPMPAYQSGDAAGLDLAAAVPETTPVMLEPGARAMVPTGLVIALPRGFEAQVRPRSGLAARYGITVLNSPGTIDADYRGEVQVVLINHGDQPFTIARGERIAQLVVAPVVQAMLVETKVVDRTVRGAGGFGSTGIRSVDAAKPAKKSKPPARSRRAAKKTPARQG